MKTIYVGHLQHTFPAGEKLDCLRPILWVQSHCADALDAYRSLVHRAGMMSVLSVALVRRLDRTPLGEKIVSHCGNDGRVYQTCASAPARPRQRLAGGEGATRTSAY